MRSLRLVLLTVIVASLLAGGCSSNNTGKIEGTRWKSDLVKDGKKITPVGAKQLDFRTDGTLTYQEGGQSSTGSYVLGSGDNVTFKLKKEVGGSKSPAKKIIVEGNKLTLIKVDDVEETYSKAGDVR